MLLKDLLSNLRVNLRAKPINIRLHFIREIVESKLSEVVEVGTENNATEDNATDAFTKVVASLKFKYCMKILSIEVK